MARAPAACLADDFMEARHAIATADVITQANDELRPFVKRAHKYVLDDAATVLACQLSNSAPEQMLKMLGAARPPFPVTWVELPAKVMLDARGYIGNPSWTEQQIFAADNRSPAARVGILIIEKEDLIAIYLIEHGDDPPHHFTWPVSFLLALEGRPWMEEDLAGRKVSRDDLISLAGAFWGYSPSPAVAPLIGRATARPPEPRDPSSKAELAAVIEMTETSVRETAGITRMAIAVLAMLNSVPIVETEFRQTGMRLLKGAMRPYSLCTTVSLNIPRRVRRIEGYARKAIGAAAARKRLHEVRTHYRHLPRRPLAPGWTEAIGPEGEVCWRKPIKGHLRGDPDLGVAEPKTTIVHGPRATKQG